MREYSKTATADATTTSEDSGSAHANSALHSAAHASIARDHASPTGNREQTIHIQTELTRLGLYHYTIDGIFGSRTRAGIEQALGRGIHLESVSPSEIHSKLTALPSKRTPAPHEAEAATRVAPAQQLMNPNDEESTELQTELKRLGVYNHDPVKGFGPVPRAALTHAWGNQSWEALTPDVVVKRLQGIRTPIVLAVPKEVQTHWTVAEIRAVQAEMKRLGVSPDQPTGRLDASTRIALNEYFNGDDWSKMSVPDILKETKGKALLLDKEKAENSGKHELSFWEKAELAIGGLGASAMGILPEEAADHPTDPGARAHARVQSLQTKIDDIAHRCKTGTVSADDEKFIEKLYWAVVAAGYVTGRSDASNLLANYLRCGKEDPYNMSSSVYEDSPVVQAEMVAQKQKAAQMIKGGGPVKLQSHTLVADTEKLLMCNNHFFLTSTTEVHGSGLRTEFRVDDTYYFESFERNKSTPLSIAGETVELPHGLSKYLIQLGVAKEFTYSSSWTERWSQSDVG